MKLLPLITLLLVPATFLHAQERAAGSALETQMTWSSLKALIDNTTALNTATNSRIDKLTECGKQGMLYAPDAPGAVNGCLAIKASSAPKTSVATATVNAFRWPAATATCPANTTMLSGGGTCTSSIGWMFVNRSVPAGNGWQVGCDTEKKINATATAYAVCMANQ